MTVANNQPIELVLRNTIERIDIFVTDAEGNAVDATGLQLQVFDQGENLLFQDDFFAGYGNPATPPTQIVKPASTTGQYYFPFGDTSFDDANSTATTGEYLFLWKVTGVSGSEPVNIVQVAKVVSVRTMRWLPKLRLIIDKAVKAIDDNPDDPVFVGYTDSMLVQFLEGGLGWINAFQPYPMWSCIDTFPDAHWRVLLDAAVCDALTSQEIFAVDTDINYCFVEGTPVTLCDGTTRGIEAVQVTDVVLDRTGAEQTVTAAWCDGTPEELVELTLWGGRKYVVTKQHEWPVWSWPRHCLCGCGKAVPQGKVFALGHHKRVKDYKLKHVRGSLTSTTTQQSIYEGYEPIKRLSSEELVEGDFLMIPRKWDVQPTDVTVDEALMLGYYAAEGHPLFRNADPSQDYRNLCWTFCEDELGTWIQDIKRFAEKSGFELSISHDPNVHAVYVRTKNDYGRSAPVLRLAKLAKKHIGHGSLTKRLSSELMRWPREQKLAFVLGLLRGDGHQSWSLSQKDDGSANSFGVWYTTSSPFLANQLQMLLAQIGYPTSLAVEPEGEKLFYGKSYTKATSYRLKIPSGFAHELADLVWGEQSTASAHERSRVGWSPIRPECMVDDDFIYIPIKAIKTKKNDKQLRVFNLTVSGDHSYLVGDVATFNSDQGNVFVVDHQPKLSTILNTTWQRLSTMVPPMKRHYVQSGAVRVEAGPSFRFQTLLSAAPTGSLFRNAFVGGP